MTGNESAEFASPMLDSIPRGTWNLGAPVDNGVVLLDVDVPVEFTRLIVVRDEDSVTVEREDGELLQVDFTTGAVRPVLVEPVRRLKFEISRMTGKTALWHAIGEGVRAASTEGMEHLAYTIGDNVQLKRAKMEREQRESRRIARLNQRHGGRQ